jgi:hypothetical protein
LTPTSRDASTTVSLLSSTGIAAEPCATFTALVQELEGGAAAMLLPEEALSAANIGVLREVLVRQAQTLDFVGCADCTDGENFTAESLRHFVLCERC